MKFGFDRVSVSSLLLTLCVMILMFWNLKWAATLGTRSVQLTEKLYRPNYEASIALASLALEIVVLIVIWTSYQKRMRWSWFVMAVFLCVYLVPVHLLDLLLTIRSVGWSWWPQAFREAMEGRQLALEALSELAVFTLMLIALLVPLGAFFQARRGPLAPRL